jgi:hypothetical protein
VLSWIRDIKAQSHGSAGVATHWECLAVRVLHLRVSDDVVDKSHMATRIRCSVQMISCLCTGSQGRAYVAIGQRSGLVRLCVECLQQAALPTIMRQFFFSILFAFAFDGPKWFKNTCTGPCLPEEILRSDPGGHTRLRQEGIRQPSYREQSGISFLPYGPSRG